MSIIGRATLRRLLGGVLVLRELRPELQNMANGTGELILISSEPNKKRYKMLHDDGSETFSFPVFFIKDEEGNWRIFNF